MNIFYKYGLLLLLSMYSLGIKAQIDMNDICRVEGGRIIFKLNLKWTDKEKKEIALQFDLDSALLAKAYSGVNEFFSNGIQWKVKKIKSNQIELSIPIDIPEANISPEDTLKQAKRNRDFVILMDDKWQETLNVISKETATYGVNNFKRSSILKYEDGITHFYLPGFKNSKKVYLAGSFNNWSTDETPMELTDSGWIASVKLQPGKYHYKFISDGKWMTDPNNKLSEDDGYGNINSYAFCYNYSFRLQGHLNAKKVAVAGSFNNWDRNELPMTKASDGWILPLYLNQGTYTYKFIVDNEWITDPENKVTRNDGSGNNNSVIGIGDTYLFKLKGFSDAKQVILAGTFNNWNSGELLMSKTAGGWELPYILAPGNYEYKFIVDGKWMKDPDNPYSMGTSNMENSVLAFKPNYTFTLSKFPDAKQVIVSGNFNNWNPEGYTMQKKDGVWSIPVYLKTGKCTYKFIVDGKWILDPDNKLWEENEYGTGNSLLWITTGNK
jgi:1,4-alpha-glucan branching enzyme